MKPYAYSLRSNAHVSFPCYFNSWILIWVLFGTQINIHVLGALTHKISSVEVRDRGAKWRRGFYRVSTFDLNFATRNVAYLSDCPVIIAKQACSHVTLNIHSQFSVLCLFVWFVFCFVLVVFVFVFICFALLWSFRFRLFVLLLLRTEELEVSPCPLTNVILIEKIAQILTMIGLALGIKTIIITLDTK